MSDSNTAVDDRGQTDETVPLKTLASLPEFYHPVASPDGSRIAYYYDGTGRNELYVQDVETGERTQVSDGEVPRDASYPIAWDADGERLFFHKDDAGDEQNDVHALGLDGDHDVVVATDGQGQLQDVGPDGRYLLYTTTASGQMNLHRHDTDTGESDQLTDYEQPVQNGVFSPAGDRIAYTTNESDDLENTDAYVADADGSNPRKLDLGEEGSETGVVDWHPDGRRLVVSDDAEDMNAAGIYDLEADDVTWFGDRTYDERPATVLPDGETLLAIRFRECAVMPIRYDLDDPDDATALSIPDGSASVVSGAHDAGILADGSVLLSHTVPDRRSELYRYDLDADSYDVLIEAEYGDLDPDVFVDCEYVSYESTDGLEIEGLLYDSGERPSPGVVHVHGGPHAAAFKRFDLYAQFLVSRGYTVFQPNYRGSVGRGREFKNRIHDDWGGMEQADIAEAGRWLEARDWIDEDRVAVYGGSYGGFSAYSQLVKYPELWTTGIAWVGMTDLLTLYEESMPHFKTGLEQQLGDPEENEELYRERSPITHVDEMERPILIAHGVNDPRCPISQARLFKEALEERGWEAGEDGDFEYAELGEEGHGSTDVDQKIRAFQLVADYLDRRL